MDAHNLCSPKEESGDVDCQGHSMKAKIMASAKGLEVIVKPLMHKHWLGKTNQVLLCKNHVKQPQRVSQCINWMMLVILSRQLLNVYRYVLFIFFSILKFEACLHCLGNLVFLTNAKTHIRHSRLQLAFRVDSGLQIIIVF